MLNQQEYNYLKDFVFSRFLNDNLHYYYCETIYNSYNSNNADVVCYLSKKEFSLFNGTLTNSNSVKRCYLDFDTYGDSVPSESCSDLNSLSYSISTNEISYSSMGTDIIKKDIYTNSCLFAICLILVIIFIYNLLTDLFN